MIADIVPEDVQKFFTWQYVATIGGASVAVMLLSNTIRALLKRDSAWVPFICSLAVSFLGAAQLHQLGNFADGFITFLNACLLFCNAYGLNATAANASNKVTAGVQPQAARPIRWLQQWYKGSEPH